MAFAYITQIVGLLLAVVTLYAPMGGAYPQSTKFSDKNAVFTDNTAINAQQAPSLESRFDGTSEVKLPPNSIGFYPYGNHQVPYLIPNPYPSLQSNIYGFTFPNNVNAAAPHNGFAVQDRSSQQARENEIRELMNRIQQIQQLNQQNQQNMVHGFDASSKVQGFPNFGHVSDGATTNKSKQ